MVKPKRSSKTEKKYRFVYEDYSLMREVVVRVCAPDNDPRFAVFFNDPTSRSHLGEYTTSNPSDAFGFAGKFARERGLEVVVQIERTGHWNNGWGKLVGFDYAA